MQVVPLFSRLDGSCDICRNDIDLIFNDADYNIDEIRLLTQGYETFYCEACDFDLCMACFRTLDNLNSGARYIYTCLPCQPKSALVETNTNTKTRVPDLSAEIVRLRELEAAGRAAVATAAMTVVEGNRTRNDEAEVDSDNDY
jgi:hypothetical protein